MTVSALIRTYEDVLNRTISLVASENRMSPDAVAAAASDLANRYCIPPAHERPPSIWEYPNQATPREIERLAKAEALSLFGGAYADCRPLSGNNAACIVLQALVPRGGRVMGVPAHCGGHFATQVICDSIGAERVDLRYDHATGCIDVEASARSVRGRKIDLIFLDASQILFPHPVAQLRDVFGDDVTIVYDASHVMGLIAGRQFQDPIGEGADLMQGSTHKTLFGPQKGLVVCRNEDWRARRIAEGVVPLFVSNVHVHHIAALAVALEELQMYGASYASGVVTNARALAEGLAEEGAQPLFPSLGFTRSHQVIVPIGERAKAEHAFFQLEAAGLFSNCTRVPFIGGFGLRMGTAELTRRGFEAHELRQIGSLIARVVRGEVSLPAAGRQFTEMSAAHPGLSFWRGQAKAVDEVPTCAA